MTGLLFVVAVGALVWVVTVGGLIAEDIRKYPNQRR